MTGPEHYRRAEALLEYQQRPGFGDVDDENRVVESYGPVTGDYDPYDPLDISRNPLMAAQVHATLALAAATAINAPMPNRAAPAEVDAWRQAAGEATPGKGVPS